MGQPMDVENAENQKRMQRDADRRLLAVCVAFNEIQTSGNPLTPEEVDRLIARRPARYGVLAANGAAAKAGKP